MTANDDKGEDLRESGTKPYRGVWVWAMAWPKAKFYKIFAGFISIVAVGLLTGLSERAGVELLEPIKKWISASLSDQAVASGKGGAVQQPAGALPRGPEQTGGKHTAPEPPPETMTSVPPTTPQVAGVSPLSYERACAETPFDVTSLRQAIADELAQHQTSAQPVVQLNGGMTNLQSQEDGATVRVAARFSICLDSPSSECLPLPPDCSAHCNYSKADTFDANRKFVNDALRERIVSSLKYAHQSHSIYTQGNLCDAP